MFGMSEFLQKEDQTDEGRDCYCSENCGLDDHSAAS